jgi:hypothetical protein
MSIQTLGHVFEHSKATGAAFTVLIVLANHEGDHDGDLYCWPSIDTIAREARCSRRTAIDSIAILETIGELGVDRNAHASGTNIYRVLVRGGADSAPVQSGGAILHPNRKEPKALKPRSKSAAQHAASVDNRPDHDQVSLAEKITATWNASPSNLGLPALQRLNNTFGRPAVADALRSLHGFPPEEAVRSPYAYVESICREAVSA